MVTPSAAYLTTWSSVVAAMAAGAASASSRQSAMIARCMIECSGITILLSWTKIKIL
jgi:hypothetical protein